jgi:hypothetical protein
LPWPNSCNNHIDMIDCYSLPHSWHHLAGE